MLSGGIDLGDLKPLCEGETVAGARGTHAGPANGLNIHNAQPGFQYSWIRHPRHDRGGAQLQQFLNWGYEVCGPNSPELKAKHNNLAYAQLGLDGYQAHGDVILVRIPDELYRVRQEHRAQQAKEALDGASTSFIDKGRDLTSRYSYARSADGPLYYRGPGHFVGNPDDRTFAAEETR